jgi:hypothetical protein
MTTHSVVVASKLAPASRFWSRMGLVAMIALALLGGTLAVGTVGYHEIAGIDWLPSVHQAALLLSGMGPVETRLSDAGRIFESVYAIFCGVALLFATGILLTPVVHRCLHSFHIEDARADK